MDQPIETGENRPSQEPIGDVLVGINDPRTMTTDEFSHSPDLLFHGSGTEFSFSQDFDYMANEEQNSRTLGHGFYATANRRDAELYSEHFSHDGRIRITEVLPFQAHMFDFRKKTDPANNASVPADMIEDYRKYVAEQFEINYKDYDPENELKIINEAPSASGSGSVGNEDVMARRRRFWGFSFQKEYQSFLRTLVGKKNVDLRSMMSVDGDSSKSQMFAHSFKEFMIGRGYDGVIYRELGDHPEHRKTYPAAYVFYNLSKLGTHDAWQKAPPMDASEAE